MIQHLSEQLYGRLGAICIRVRQIEVIDHHDQFLPDRWSILLARSSL